MPRPKADAPGISLRRSSLAKVPAKTLAVPVFEGAAKPHADLRSLDRRLGGLVTRRIALGDFRGRASQVTCLFPPQETGIRRAFLFGLGPEGELDLEGLRRAAASLALEAMRQEVDELVVAGVEAKALPRGETARALAEGLLLASYRFDRFRTRSTNGPRPGARPIRFAVASGRGFADIALGLRRARIYCAATRVTRDIANTPGAEMTPAGLAAAARRLARDKGLRCTVYDPRGIARIGMRALLAVGQGSRNGPRFIRVEWRPTKPAGRTVALVGKGITFDSGGISIKPSANLFDMKFDKSGAAAVLGAMHAIADLEVPARVIALVPAAENMPSGSAYRPGDIVRTYSGRTVEIRSTDAEGRLVLADALHYAARLRPDAIIDVATLTGACSVALGAEAAGLFGTNDSLLRALALAGDETGERVWAMPLWKDYERLIESPVADLKNSGGRAAGAITAAAFLAKFVGEIPWAHLDIAGTAHTDTARAYRPEGATGFGARLLARAVETFCQR